MTTRTRNKIKSFIALNGTYIKDLAALMSQKSSKKYTEDSLGGKIRRESLTFKEAELMADVLGYNLEFIKR
ncbi:hypothetical protein J6G99_00575 [bacterium]|nr:hypothetical protein [bacterium]